MSRQESYAFHVIAQYIFFLINYYKNLKLNLIIKIFNLKGKKYINKFSSLNYYKLLLFTIAFPIDNVDKKEQMSYLF